MVVCLKPVGITDWVRERLKMSVKALAFWLAHALNINLLKGLIHIGYKERDHEVVRKSLCSHVWFSVACLEASIEGI